MHEPNGINCDLGGVCRSILFALPEWFGRPEAVDGYARRAGRLPMLGLSAGGLTVGLVSYEAVTPITTEIVVMAS